MRNQRNTVLLIGFAALTLGALSCGGRDRAGNRAASPDAAAAPVEIQFWTRHTQSERQERIRLLLDVFETLNPDVKAAVLPVEENDFPAQLAAAGEVNRPHLIEIQAFRAMSFFGEGIVDAEANAELARMIGEDSFLPGALDEMRMSDGRLFGLPFHFSAHGFWYRKDWFAEAGLEPPNTWESILAAAEYFNNPADKRYGILIGTKPEAYTQQAFTHLATANGAHLFDNRGNPALSSPEFRETVELYRKLSGYTPPGPQNWRARDYYIQGRMAMFYYSTYIMDDLSIAEAAESSLSGDNFDDLEGAAFDADLVENTGFAPLITNTATTGYSDIMALSLLKTAGDGAERETEAAKRLAAFFMADENYIPYLHIQPGGLLATTSSALASDAFLDDPKGVYARYGRENIMEIVNGLGDIEDFLKKDDVIFPDSADILAKNILAQMLYNITIENRDIDAEIAAAEREIARLLSQ